MGTIVRIPFSVNSAGSAVIVAKVATPGNTIHTSTPSTGVLDYVTLRANNLSTSDVLLTLEKGGVTDAQLKRATIYARLGDQTVLDREQMGLSMTLAAFAAASSVIVLSGWVDRVTP